MHADIWTLARKVADGLAAVDGIIAVALGGSWARGEAGLDADVDLLLYYDDARRPRVEDLRRLARALNSHHTDEMVTDLWARGPFVNGGAWLYVDGQRVEWHYRDLDRVALALEQAEHGSVTSHYQPGYPHGFFSNYLLGEAYYAKVLYDPEARLQALKSCLVPFPESLKHALIRTFSEEADLSLFAAQKAAASTDTFYAAGCLFRCVACLVQVLAAYNEIHLAGERGAVGVIMQSPHRPPGFEMIVEDVLANGAELSLMTRIDALRELVSEVQLTYVRPLLHR